MGKVGKQTMNFGQDFRNNDIDYNNILEIMLETLFSSIGISKKRPKP